MLRLPFFFVCSQIDAAVLRLYGENKIYVYMQIFKLSKVKPPAHLLRKFAVPLTQGGQISFKCLTMRIVYVPIVYGVKCWLVVISNSISLFSCNRVQASRVRW